MGATSKTMSELLEHRISQHVKPGQGISNQLVERLCRRLCGKDFSGVFSADYLPLHLAARPKFMLVVNLGKRRGIRPPQKLPPGHFVTVVGEPGKVYYLDPYGLPCDQKDVAKFLRHCRRPVAWNRRQIQAYNSNYCGLYAILFCVYLDSSSQYSARLPPLSFTREKNKLRSNDRECFDALARALMQKRTGNGGATTRR